MRGIENAPPLSEHRECDQILHFTFYDTLVVYCAYEVFF